MKHQIVLPRLSTRRLLFIVVGALFLVLLACRRSDKQTVSTDTQAAEASTSTPEPEGTETPTVSTSPGSSTAAELASLSQYSADCGGTLMDLGGPVQEIAAKIEAASLLYDTKPLTDCSGIFHRVLQAMKARCPGYDFPTPETYRDTRDLARWYHERGELILVRDALQDAELIKAGAVLFYGQRDTEYKDFTVEELLQKGTGINHMGVVVRVHRDPEGKVVRYELFHGHGTKGKTPASTTKWHQRNPRTGPPFGNGTEQWVAFARLVPPSAKLLTERQ